MGAARTRPVATLRTASAPLPCGVFTFARKVFTFARNATQTAVFDGRDSRAYLARLAEIEGEANCGSGVLVAIKWQ